MREISGQRGLFFVLLNGLKMCDRYKIMNTPMITTYVINYEYIKANF